MTDLNTKDRKRGRCGLVIDANRRAELSIAKAFSEILSGKSFLKLSQVLLKVYYSNTSHRKEFNRHWWQIPKREIFSFLSIYQIFARLD
ncbi:CLUMA_CG006008, isoform A [Clunio marinus]|uniref:CLUMA_CG006008, isoform A n=1 Tax=Clunio marinus TaxID=568069 RepID=A0A1J1I243_9DIPT|nr:CLUMA_CG006008, isoform A [Clunio marinus]